MYHAKKGLVTILILMAISVPSVHALGTSFAANHNGMKNTVSQGFGSNGAVDSSLNSQNRVLALTTDFTGDYSFSDQIANAEGDTAGVSVSIPGYYYGPYVNTLGPQGTHVYGSQIGDNYALYWQTLSANQEDWIHADVWASNANHDFAWGDVYVDSWESVPSSAYVHDASISDYWGVAMAGINYGFAAQGFDSP